MRSSAWACCLNLFPQGRTRFCSWFVSEGGEDIWTENKHDMITFLAKKVSSFAFWFLLRIQTFSMVCKHYGTLCLSLVHLLKLAGCQHLSSAHFSLRIKEIKNESSSRHLHFTQSKQAHITILTCHMESRCHVSVQDCYSVLSFAECSLGIVRYVDIICERTKNES